MQRLAKILFSITDGLAWLVLGFCVFSALTYPIVGPIYTRMSQLEMSTMQAIGGSLILALAAWAAHLLRHRKLLGLPLLLLASGAWAWHAEFNPVALMAVLSFVFGSPYAAAWLDFRERREA